MKTLLLFFFISISNCLYGQWSTSPKPDSALYVCYGFYTGIVTYEDGSSIILGALSSYIFVQKLDEFGYKQWETNGILAHYNDSSYIGAGLFTNEPWGGWVSDGDGGIIFCWFDHRHSYADEGGIRNNSIYAQRVDKNGNIMWQEGGVEVKGPASGLKRSAGIIDDGAGGCIITWADNGFNYPEAPNLFRITAQRLSPDGEKIWEKEIDSSASNVGTNFYYMKTLRIDDRIFLQYQGINNLEIIDLSGELITPAIADTLGDIFVSDSTLYSSLPSRIVRQNGDTTFRQRTVVRFTKNMDYIYKRTFEDYYFGQFYYYLTPIVPDGFGGIYTVSAFQSLDSSGIGTGHLVIQHTDGNEWWSKPLQIDSSDRPFAAKVPDGSLIIYNVPTTFYVQKFGQEGQIIWPRPIQMLDTTLIENEVPASDNNGGIILVYMVNHLGGIYAQHSGRTGHLGILTSVSILTAVPLSFTLNQNYPNPFNGVTVISFSLPQRIDITLTVYNVLGEKISEIFNNNLDRGNYQIRFDSRGLSSGTYFYELKSKYFKQVKKMLLLR